MLRYTHNIALNNRPPFGSCISNRGFSSAAYRYGFNGKEKETDGTADNYDFGARIYDGRLGRWLSVDPLFNKYVDCSPFIYCKNTPQICVDPDGKAVIIKNKADRQEVLSYFTQIFGENHGFKVNMFGKLKVNDKWVSKTLENPNISNDYKEVLLGFQNVIDNKSTKANVKIQDANYNVIHTEPIYELQQVTKTVMNETVTVSEYVGVGVKDLGYKDIGKSTTIMFEDNPKLVYINIHRADANYQFKGFLYEECEVGQCSELNECNYVEKPAQGSLAAAFAHEVLDHFKTICDTGLDHPLGGDKTNKVKFENKARNLLGLNLRSGEDHD